MDVLIPTVRIALLILLALIVKQGIHIILQQVNVKKFVKLLELILIHQHKLVKAAQFQIVLHALQKILVNIVFCLIFWIWF